MTEFQHSVKVPRLYKDASRILKSVHEGGSLKDLVYNHNKFSNIKALHALVGESLKYDKLLSRILHSINILNLEKFDEWLAKVLLTELIFGKKRLPGNSKPILTLLKYQEDIKKQLNAADICNITSYSREKRKAVKPRYVRVNTLKISLEDAINKFKDEGWEELACPCSYDEYLQLIQDRMFSEEFIFIQDYHIENLLVFPSTVQFYDHPAYLEKYIILQDKASCLLTRCVSIKPGSIILDMCAAPGMKTSLLAACINNEGKIYAIEQDIRRYSVMTNLLNDFGITCVVSGNSDAGSIGPDTCKNVKYIVVDPSCSGSGMTSRIEDVEGHTESNQYYTKLRLQKLANIQGYLLRHAVSNFPTVKYVFYSTCSLQEEENEMVVESVLGCAKHHGFSLMNLKKKMYGWKNFGSDKYECGRKCVYSKPDCDFTNGGFLAVFKRKSENFNIDDRKIKEELMDYEITTKKSCKPLSEQFFALVNTLKISVEDTIQCFVDNGWKHLPTPINYNIFLSGLQDDKKRIEERFFEQDFHVKELLVFPMGIVDELSERFIKEHKFILLDKVSCLAVNLLDTIPGCKVLDMCAGAEKITLFLASKMNNSGTVYAYEPNSLFHRELVYELKTSGISCVNVKLDSGLYSNSNDCPGVKLILVSPPCSGSGSGLAEKTQYSLIKNTSNTRKDYILRHYIVTQFSLLRHAFTEFPEAHRIVYVTRSVHPEENEDIINALLVTAKFHGFELIDAPSRIDGWNNEYPTKYYWSKKCLITRDETSITKGFFIAVFERNIKNLKNLKLSNDSSKNCNSSFSGEKTDDSNAFLGLVSQNNSTSSTEQKNIKNFDSSDCDKDSRNNSMNVTKAKKCGESTDETFYDFLSNSFQDFEELCVNNKNSIEVCTEISDPKKQSDLSVNNKKHKKRKRKIMNEDTFIDVDATISNNHLHLDQKEDNVSNIHVSLDSESCSVKVKKRKKVIHDLSDNIPVKRKTEKQKKHSTFIDKSVIVPGNENDSFQFDGTIAKNCNTGEGIISVLTGEAAEAALVKSKSIKGNEVELLVKKHKKKKKGFKDLDLDEIFSMKTKKQKKLKKDNDELTKYNENSENFSNEFVAAEENTITKMNLEETKQCLVLDNKKQKKKKKKHKE